ncbi:MAG: SBBP repeat-containing protein [Bacteroidetes bacterium]|nr:SBBP repeat-containing protein [Bacteroidota bacterium]
MHTDWVRRYTGPGSLGDGAGPICVDDSGNVFITGVVSLSNSVQVCTTIKYNKYGDSLWVRNYRRPGENYNIGHDIKIDDSGNVYIAGAISLIKYDKYGNLKWTRYDSTDYNKLVIDSLGNIYVAGLGQGRYIVAKYDQNGNRFWINKHPGAYRLHDLAMDNSGNILISVETEYNDTYYDYNTIKYTNDGRIIWIRHYNGPGPAPLADDIPFALTTDNNANVYVTGASQDPSSTYNCATVKYDSSGNVIWVKRIHPPVVGYDIEVDKFQNVYITGRSDGTNNTLKLDINGNIVWSRTYPTTDGFATNVSVLILDSIYNIYVTANIDSNSYTRYGAIKYDNNGNQLFVVNYTYPGNRFNYVQGMFVDKLGNVYLTGESQGAYYDYATVKYSPIITGISENNLFSEKYELEQNFPNPFNPNTKFKISLPVDSRVSITVYDLLGREVEKLINNDFRKAGIYTVEFTAKNLSSGVYFYRLEVYLALRAGSFIQTKRMILLK